MSKSFFTSGSLPLLLFVISLSGVQVVSAEDHYAQLSRELGLDPKDDLRQAPLVLANLRVRQAMQLARAKDYEALDRYLAKLPPPSEWSSADATLIPQLYEGLAAWFDQEQGAWLKARPDSANANYVAGVCTLKRAWAARGSGYANTVKEEGWKVWRKLVPQAKAQIDRALELDPKHVLAHAHRLKVDRCVQTPHEEFDST